MAAGDRLNAAKIPMFRGCSRAPSGRATKLTLKVAAAARSLTNTLLDRKKACPIGPRNTAQTLKSKNSRPCRG